MRRIHLLPLEDARLPTGLEKGIFYRKGHTARSGLWTLPVQQPLLGYITSPHIHHVQRLFSLVESNLAAQLFFLIYLCPQSFNTRLSCL